MPSASVTCPGWPASCDGAWGAVAVDDSADAPAQAATNDGPRDYATPAEVDCPTTPDAPAVATGECSEPPLNLWYRVSRFPDSEQPTGSLVAAPRRAHGSRGITSGGAPDVGHLVGARGAAGGSVRAAWNRFHGRAQSFGHLESNDPGPRARAAGSTASRLSKVRGLWFDARVGRAAPPQVPVLFVARHFRLSRNGADHEQRNSIGIDGGGAGRRIRPRAPGHERQGRLRLGRAGDGDAEPLRARATASIGSASRSKGRARGRRTPR